MIPPYYEDWSVAADSSSFEGPPSRTYPINWMNYAGHPQLVEAYMGVVQYSLETMLGFAQQLDRPALLIILGDHQPPNVGNLRKRDSSFDVPVHVVANDVRLLTPFRKYGFVPGLVPSSQTPSFGFSFFLDGLVAAFGSTEAR
jgi:hypothetical protein